MARRNNLYEIALEHALRMREMPVIGIAETLKASLSGREFKNFDYLVYRENGPHWLLEVKGRKLSHSNRGDPWITASDLTCLDAWQMQFGQEYQPFFAFVFDATGRDGAEVHHHAFDRDWQFWLVDLLDYQRLARPRSPKWRTLALSVKAFDAVAQPLLASSSQIPAPSAPDMMVSY